MAELTCGEGGSTGAEIVTQINWNTEDIETRRPFKHNTIVDTLDIPETYTKVAELHYVDMPSGVYILNMTSTYQLDVVNKSVFVQFILDNGTPEEFSREPKDKTDRSTFNYSFPYTHTNTSPFDFELFMRKEDTSGTLDCFFGNVWIEKKAELPVTV